MYYAISIDQKNALLSYLFKQPFIEAEALVVYLRNLPEVVLNAKEEDDKNE